MSEYQVIEGAHSARAGCARRASARRRCPCSLGGCGPPGLPPCAYARAAARPPRGRRPGPGGGQGPHSRPSRSRAYGAPQRGMWGPASLAPLPFGSGCCGRFLAASGAAAPLRCACWARPLRAGPPGPASRPRSGVSSLALRARRGRAAPFPPGSLARAVCAAVRLRGRSLPPLRFASPRCAVGFLWAPLLCSGALLRFGSARRVPPWSPALRLRARGLRARGLGGVAAVLVALPPGAFFARVLRPLRCPPAGGVLPLSPRPFPRWGKGCARPVPGGCGPRAALRPGSPGVEPLSFCRASSHCSGGARVKPSGCAALALRRSLGVAARQKGVSAYEAFGSSVNHRFAEGVPWSLSRR